MKKGDRVPVNIGNAVIGNAEVEHVGESQATLFVPAMRVVMSIRVELDDAPPAPPEKETVIIGVERPENNLGDASAPAAAPDVSPAAEVVNATAPTDAQAETPAVAKPSAEQLATETVAEATPVPVKTDEG